MLYRCIACDAPTGEGAPYCSNRCGATGEALYLAASDGASWLQAADREGLRARCAGLGRSAHAVVLARSHAARRGLPWPPGTDGAGAAA